MRVLIHSPAFLPGLGGLEVQTAMVAEGLAAAGDEVIVVTQTPFAVVEPGTNPEVVRSPSPARFLSSVRWSDVVLHQNLSLKGLWPLMLCRRPLVVAHHSWYRRDGRVGFRERMKRWIVARAAGSIAVSRAIAVDLGSPCVVLPNAYRSNLFGSDGLEPRDRELLFVGRLVSDKGVDLLIEALGRLPAPVPGLTIVGDGPDRRSLEELAAALGLGGAVVFEGPLTDDELASAYRRHRVLVVPSRYEEPFGIVALEGIASGCVVVASNGGGLPEAVGPCGLLFERGNVEDLRDSLIRALSDSELAREVRAQAPAHLARHTPEAMTVGYRKVLEAAAGGRR